jgi:hypothetical protein
MEIMRIIENYTQQLKEAETRLKALTQQGAKALSRYDIEIAHQGNAKEALRTAKWLVGNNINYCKRKITEIGKEPRQLELLEL